MGKKSYQTSLCSLSPLDGRYHTQVECLRDTFSEYGLIRTRVLVECRWLRHLIQRMTSCSCLSIPAATQSDFEFLSGLENCSLEDAEHVKKFEQKVQHDVKATEDFIRERIQNAFHQGLLSEAMLKWKEFIHFCCTSEDINNLSYAILLKAAVHQIFRPHLLRIIKAFARLAAQYKDVCMLSRTHGQPAVPTTFGKEMALFSYRLASQLTTLDAIRIHAKFNGAVGNFNAHRFIYPNLNWSDLCKEFVEGFQLFYQPFSTQIESHDYIGELSHCLIRIHTICLDAVQDIWQYISRRYLVLLKNEDEVGSSTMPHKINPIDFENAEGNLGLANALFQFFATKLCVSRLQRDLSDSTVLRNLGSGFGYSILALNSIEKGLSKIQLARECIKDDLNRHWEILGEPLQIYLRSQFIPNGYEILKSRTRGVDALNEQGYKSLLKELNSYLSDEDRDRLETLTPETYVGDASLLTQQIIDSIAQL